MPDSINYYHSVSHEILESSDVLNPNYIIIAKPHIYIQKRNRPLLDYLLLVVLCLSFLSSDNSNYSPTE